MCRAASSRAESLLSRTRRTRGRHSRAKNNLLVSATGGLNSDGHPRLASLPPASQGRRGVHPALDKRRAAPCDVDGLRCRDKNEVSQWVNARRGV